MSDLDAEWQLDTKALKVLYNLFFIYIHKQMLYDLYELSHEAVIHKFANAIIIARR